MKAHKPQLQKCVDLARKEIACIEKDTYKLLHEHKLDQTDHETYMVIYNINQKLHHVKHIIDTYCDGKSEQEF